MKSSHELAAELLSYPDLPLRVVRWGGEEVGVECKNDYIENEDETYSDAIVLCPR